MNAPRITGLIADDEPLLRERLAAQLARLWPGLDIVAQARNGREAVELAEQHAPEVAFLDVHMPASTAWPPHGPSPARRHGRWWSSSRPSSSTRCRPSSRVRWTTW
jgi:CheY-like chemotaxis protein